MHTSGFVPEPEKCICGNKYLNIQSLSSKKSGFCFRYILKNVNEIILLEQIVFFSKFTHISIESILEVFKCYLCLKFNINQYKKYSAEGRNILYSSKRIREGYGSS